MSCGTTSKETGKKSKPCSRARVSSSATRASNMRHLPRLQKGLQHLEEFFLVGNGHTQQAGMRNALQGILQRARGRAGLPNPAIEARVIAVANLPVAHHAAMLQQRVHQSLTDGVIVRQIVAIREVEEIRVPAVTRVMLLQMRQRELIGGRTARPPPLSITHNFCELRER